MKITLLKNSARLTLTFGLAALIASPAVHAATLFWDGGATDILSAGNGASGGTNGTWNTTILNWDQGNALAHVNWTNANNDTAVFAGTVGTVSVASPVTVGGMVFSTASYVLTNGVVTFGVAGTISNSVAATIRSSLAGGVAIAKDGVGTLTLSGTNAFSGGTILNAGTTAITLDSNLGASSGSITFNGGQLTVSSANISAAREVTVNAGGGSIVVNKNNNFTTSQKLTGSGQFTALEVGGAGTAPTYIFNSTSNDFTGALVIRSGAAFTCNSFADSTNNIIFPKNTDTSSTFTYGAIAPTPLTLNGRAIEINAASVLTVTIANNNTTNAITISPNLLATGAGAKTLTLGGVAGPTNVFGGSISDGTGGGTVAVSKSGAGTWALSGTNTYSGATTLSAGRLVAVVSGSCSNSDVTVSAGTLSVSITDNTKQWNCKSLTHSAASTLEFAFGANTPSTNLAPLQVNGNVAFNATPTVSCTGSSLPAGTYPLITWTGAFSGVVPASVTLSSGTGILVLDNANKTLWLSISATGGRKQPLTWKGPAGSEWIANEAVYTKWQDATPALTNYQETTVSGVTVGDSVLFTNTPGGVVSLNTTVYPASMSVIGTNNYTISGSGSIGGAGGLTKTSTGTLTLSTTNSYSGGTMLGAGTLIIATNDVLGTGSLVLSGGIIRSSDATARTLNNAVVLNGNSTVGGTGDLSFTSTGAGAVNANSTVTVSNNVTATFATAFGGAFGITKAGLGTMTLTGTNTYGGGTTVNAGSLVVNGGQIAGAGALSLASANATMIITNGGQVFSGAASAIGNGSASHSNTVLVVGGSGGTSLWNLGNQELYFGAINNAGGRNNRLLIDGSGVAGGAVVTNVSNLWLGRCAANSDILLTNGARMSINGALYTGSSYYNGGTSNTITIVGGAADSIFSGSSSIFAVGYGERQNANYNQVIVGAGGVLTNVGYNAGNREVDFVVGYGVTGSGNGSGNSNHLVVTDGGKVFTLGNLTVGYGTGAGSFASGNSLLIANGGLVRAAGGLYVGANQSSSSPGMGYNSLTITNGGQLYTRGVSYIGRANGNGLTNLNNTAWIGFSLNGTNAVWDLGGTNLLVGFTSGTGRSTGNVLTVSSGGVVTNVATLVVGSGSSSNNLVVLDGGSIYANSLFVTNAGIISGTGTVVAAVNVSSNSTLSPGASIGTLTVGSLTLAGTYQVELDAGSAGDKVVVTNTVNVSGATLSVTNLGAVGGSYTIIDNVGGSAVTGTFTGWAEGATNAVYGVDYTITYAGGDGNDVVLSVSGVGAPPVASFTVTPTNGTAPLQVVFTDSSINTPTGWAWDFDNNGSVDSTDRNPTNVFSAGTYSVKLVATNAYGSSTNIQLSYITATNNAPTGYNAFSNACVLVQSPEGDDDGDGFANLYEYVTGSSPTNGGSGSALSAARTNGLFALKFLRDTNTVDATLIVEGSNGATNNANWLGIATNIAGSWGSATNVAEVGSSPVNVTAYDTDPSTNRFLRLRVTRP